jgi:hypothetical protein
MEVPRSQRTRFVQIGRDSEEYDSSCIGTKVARSERGSNVMSLVRLLGYSTLACGCVIGKYREVATSREVSYVEEKGKVCGSHGHRRNHTIALGRSGATSITAVSKAS